MFRMNLLHPPSGYESKPCWERNGRCWGRRTGNTTANSDPLEESGSERVKWFHKGKNGVLKYSEGKQLQEVFMSERAGFLKAHVSRCSEGQQQLDVAVYKCTGFRRT